MSELLIDRFKNWFEEKNQGVDYDIKYYEDGEPYILTKGDAEIPLKWYLQ